jgi:hypothetical protein
MKNTCLSNFLQALRMSWFSSSVSVSGFWQNTCLPAISASIGDLHVPVVGRDHADDIDVVALEHLAIVFVGIGFALADLRSCILRPIGVAANRRRRPPRCRQNWHAPAHRHGPCRPGQYSRLEGDHLPADSQTLTKSRERPRRLSQRPPVRKQKKETLGETNAEFRSLSITPAGNGQLPHTL